MFKYLIGVNDSEFLLATTGETIECDTFKDAFKVASDFILNPLSWGYEADEVPSSVDIEVRDNDGTTVKVIPIFADHY